MKAFTLLETGFKGVGVAHLGEKIHAFLPPLPPPRKVGPTAAERIAELEKESKHLFEAMFNNMKSSAEERYAQHALYYEVEAKLEELKASLTEETSRRVALEASVRELGDGKAAAEFERDGLAATLDVVRKKVDNITEDCDSLRASMAVATAERDDLRVDLLISRAEADTFKKTSEESQKEVGTLKAELGALQTKHTTQTYKLRERAQAAEDDLEDLRDKTKKDSIAHDREYGLLLREWESDQRKLTAARKHIAKQKNIAIDLQKDKEELERIERLTYAKLALTTALLESSRDEIVALREYLDDAKSQAAAAKKLEQHHRSEVALLNNSIYDLYDAFGSELSVRIELETKLADAEAQLEAQRFKALDAEAGLQNERLKSSMLEEQLRHAQQQLADSFRFQEEERQAHSLTQDTLVAVQSRLDDIADEKERSEVLLAQTKLLHDDTCDKLARATETSRRLSRDLKQAAEERDQLRNESSLSDSSNEDLRSMIASLTKESANLKVSKKSVEDAFTLKRDQCEALHTEVRRLTQAALAHENANAPFAVSTPLRNKDMNMGSDGSPTTTPIFGTTRFGNLARMAGGLPTPTRSLSLSMVNFFKPSVDVDSSAAYGSPVLS